MKHICWIRSNLKTLEKIKFETCLWNKVKPKEAWKKFEKIVIKAEQQRKVKKYLVIIPDWKKSERLNNRENYFTHIPNISLISQSFQSCWVYELVPKFVKITVIEIALFRPSRFRLTCHSRFKKRLFPLFLNLPKIVCNED